jgi:hypothetical protein
MLRALKQKRGHAVGLTGMPLVDSCWGPIHGERAAAGTPEPGTAARVGGNTEDARKQESELGLHSERLYTELGILRTRRGAPGGGSSSGHGAWAGEAVSCEWHKAGEWAHELWGSR